LSRSGSLAKKEENDLSIGWKHPMLILLQPALVLPKDNLGYVRYDPVENPKHLFTRQFFSN
jgi:hypothetical protein